ncbi:MAG: hypothetical protein WCI22_04705 [Actinomycetota bacterium]
MISVATDTTERSTTHRALTLIVATVAAAIPLAIAAHARVAVELADDGAFFMRYAVNAAHGHLWVWNVGHQPIWGSSAPLYPLVLAIPIVFGAPAQATLVWTGLVLSVAALTATTAVLGRRFGLAAGASFVVFCCLDTVFMYHAGSGLETPLTLVLLAAALWTLIDDVPEWTVGLISALLMVHKIDLIPFGLLLLAAVAVRRRSLPRRSVALAGGIAALWYSFAWIYFGAPVPNSFLTKALHQNNFHASITWRWFGDLVVLSSTHRWLVVFAGIALVAGVRARSPLVIFLGGGAAVHLALYTVKYPFEPYTWYAMPAIFCLTAGAAIGIGLFARWFTSALDGRKLIAYVLVSVVLVFTVGRHLDAERSLTWWTKRSISLHERDRADAGRWVAAHTPNNFTVFTDWGNPAAYSHRYVYDGSFLNMKFEEGDLIERYRPEVIIFERNPGSTPANPVFAINTKGYRIVKIFDRSFQQHEDDFFAVLVRDDVVAQLT